MDRISDSDSEDAGSIPARVTQVFVYALRNSINNEIYVGISQNISKRLKEHNTGKNRYTKAFMPWQVFYTEPHQDYASARTREKYFKHTSGKKYLRKILNDAGSLPA
jgi:putative endonuclease